MIEDSPDISFEENGHTYTHTPSGVILPSVTQIMRFMSREIYSDVPEDVLYNAADRGTRAHEQTANYDLYGLLESDEDTAPYLAAYMRFLGDYSPSWEAVEWRSYNRRHMFAGTVDRMGYLTPDDGTGLDMVDIKTTSNYHKPLLVTQLGGYTAIAEDNGIKIRRRYGLQLKNDGTYYLREIPNGTEQFYACLAIHNSLSRHDAAAYLEEVRNHE